MTLPPDPDGMNDARAEWAGEALNIFRSITGAELDDLVSDFLCDLRHWCDRQGMDYNSASQLAEQHYLAEIGDPSSVFYP